MNLPRCNIFHVFYHTLGSPAIRFETVFVHFGAGCPVSSRSTSQNNAPQEAPKPTCAERTVLRTLVWGPAEAIFGPTWAQLEPEMIQNQRAQRGQCCARWLGGLPGYRFRAFWSWVPKPGQNRSQDIVFVHFGAGGPNLAKT